MKGALRRPFFYAARETLTLTSPYGERGQEFLQTAHLVRALSSPCLRRESALFPALRLSLKGERLYSRLRLSLNGERLFPCLRLSLKGEVASVSGG